MKKMIAIALVLMLCISALSISAFAADKFTVTVEIDSSSAPYAWAWGDYGNAFTAWPGVTMTKSGNAWKIDVPMGTTGFIVNNGNGTQTANIAIPGTGDVTIKVSADYSSYEVVGQPAPVFGGYYVAGVAGLCGVEWDAGAEANKMVEGNNGVWTKTYTGIAAGSYKFKVTDGTWSNSWGQDGQDYEFSVAEANSTVVISFNANDKVVSVDVNGDNAGGGEAAPAPTFDAYYVTGEGDLLGNWTADNASGAMTEGENGIWTKTYEAAPAGTYSLKVTAGNWDYSWGGTGKDNNYDIELTEAADITVQFDENTQKVTVLVNGEATPDTGDMSLAGLSIALLAATAGLVAIVGKKKEF